MCALKNLIYLSSTKIQGDTLAVMERREKDGIEKVAIEMKKNGISVEMIMKCTGLSREEVEEL